MNVKLLRKIQKHILAEPRRLEMSEGVIIDPQQYFGARRNPKDLPPCGTAACVAGWACILSNQKERLGTPCDSYLSWLNVSAVGAEALALSYSQSSVLFDTQRWPKRFKASFVKAKRLKTRANIAVSRIDHFIKTKGAK